MGQSLTTPPDWRWHTDRPARLVTDQDVPDSAWRFVAMPPGWHLTTGPAVTLYEPTVQASGRYAVEARFAVFPNPSDQGYGVFLGGRHLETGAREFLAVLLRSDGAVSVERRGPAGSRALLPWTPAASAKPHSGKGVVGNTLRVSVEPDSLRIDVNDVRAAALPAPEQSLDGPFGLRIGSGIDLHVTTLTLTRHFAPVPPPAAGTDPED
jgi:hypothetical protein